MSLINRYQTSARMSKIASHNGVAYFCGQTSNGSPAAGITDQTSEVLSRIDTLLAEVGSDRTRLISAVIYLKSIEDFSPMNTVWEEWIPQGSAPARTTVEARLASEALLVEISIIAAHG